MAYEQRGLFDLEPPPWETDDRSESCLATVVFPEMPFGPFDYLVPEDLQSQVAAGKRLRVPLGKGNREVIGYCVLVHWESTRSAPPRGKWKDVLNVLDHDPLLDQRTLELSQWLAGQYLCEWGQAIESVLPAGVRMNAGSREVAFLKVSPQVQERLAELKLSTKQAEVLKVLAAAPRPLTMTELASQARCSQGPIQQLRKKGLLEIEYQRLDRPDRPPPAPETSVQLNHDQQRAFEAIVAALRAQHHETFLLRGVTGSGKTEVYIRAIEEVISYGRQAIGLVPEISLTPQTRQRFHSRFSRVTVLHSHLSDAERHWHWQRIARGEIQVVVGARSAIFAPTPHLGLIVLDEEHDPSFKQDVTPRYHAREVALFRAKREQVPLVLGSATPSLESWWRASQGHFRLLELPARVLNRELPEVGIVDLRHESFRRRQPSALGRQLSIAVQKTLDDHGQIILLLNRRGYSTAIQCPACGEVVRCPHCDICLTHHRADELARCHYCDYQMQAPQTCPNCRAPDIRYAGLGTQKLEAEVRARFPRARVLRMDSDTMRKPGSHEKALASFRDGETDILLGTQMIAKGLDFPNVTLVGVVNADTALHFPDFRAAERTFHLVTQVAGRTGRGARGGRVLVQTASPDHPAIRCAVRHDFLTFANHELKLRQEHGYPPIQAMIRVIIRGPDEHVVEQTANALAEAVQQATDAAQPLRILGPAPAPLARLRDLYRYHFLLTDPDMDRLRSAVRAAMAKVPAPEHVQWVADVDPVDML